VVRDVIESYRFQIEQQGFDLAVDIADDLPQVPADEEALGQAILNLLNNAIKYSRESKVIRIEVRRDGGKVLISVTDRGIGIPRSEQKKIFEKFYRGEGSLVHETKGSGLGLSLVAHIMEAHGGKVEVESAPGKGSTFTLVLPVGKA
jgi:signal transduction histidine kinase